MKKFLCLNPIKYIDTDYEFSISWDYFYEFNINQLDYLSDKDDTSFFEIPEDIELNKGDTVRLTRPMILKIGKEIYEELEGDTPLEGIIDFCEGSTLIREVFNTAVREMLLVRKNWKKTYNILTNKNIMLSSFDNYDIFTEEMFLNILNEYMDHCEEYDCEIGSITEESFYPRFYICNVTVDFKNMYKIYTVAISKGDSRRFSEKLDRIIENFEKTGYTKEEMGYRE